MRPSKEFNQYYRANVPYSLIAKNTILIYRFKIINKCLQIFGKPKRSLSITLSNQERGLFSLLAGFIDLIEYVLKYDLEPNVFIQNINYSSSEEDLLENLFDMGYRTNLNRCSTKILVSSSDELPRFRSKTASVDLSRAQGIAKKYLKVKKTVHIKIEKLVEGNGSGQYFGIHWRGTDHFNEASPIAACQIVEELDSIRAHKAYGPIKRVFIATDEKFKLNTLREVLKLMDPDLQIFFSDSYRSLDGDPIHLGASVPGRTSSNLAEQALLDCLVLAKSAVLIRVPSNLSAWCAVFNPNIVTVMLSKHKPNLNFYEWRWMY